MPRGDGTGPMGIGPMTGRAAAGRCAEYSMPGFMNEVSSGRGLRMGRGRGGSCGKGMGMGLGMGRRYGCVSRNDVAMANPIPYAPQDEITVLKNQVKFFSEALENINSRISDLKTEKK